jgi:hypothetical protein
VLETKMVLLEAGGGVQTIGLSATGGASDACRLSVIAIP